MPEIVVQRELCCGCEACAAVCPVGAVNLLEKKAQIDEKQCVRCGACISECPLEAIINTK